MADARTENSTNVRIPHLLWRGVERVAPTWLEETLFQRFCRPVRRSPEWTQVAAPRTFTLEAGAQVLRAYEWTQPNPVGLALLTHGWNGHAAQLSSYVTALFGQGFDVLAYDQPGHGGSAGSFGTIRLFADVAHELMHRVRPTVLVGHSLGATAAAVAMAEGARVPRAVWLAPPTMLRPFAIHFESLLRLPPSTRRRFEARIERYLNGPMEQLDLLAHAPRIAPAHVLVVGDLDDGVVPVATLRAVQQALPSSQWLETRGLGHDRIRRDPAVVAHAVGFLTALPIDEAVVVRAAR